MFAKEKITVFDLTNEKADRFAQPRQVREQPEVVQIIGGQLASGQTLTDSAPARRQDRLRDDGRRRRVGRAASIAVSAPVAIVDPRTREGLGDQLDELNDHVGQTVRGAADTATPDFRR